MLCPPSSCSRDPVRQIADGRISWAKAEEEFQVFDMATEWGPSSRRSRSDRICRARDLGRNVPDRILDLERAFPELANLPPVGDHRPSPVWFPVSWISSCPHLPPIRQMLRALYPQIRCLEDLEHVTKAPSGLSCQSSRQPGSPLLTPSRANQRRTGAACCCRHMATPSAEPRPKRGLTCSDCRTRLTFSAGRGRRPNRSCLSSRYAASPLSSPAPARPPLTEAN